MHWKTGSPISLRLGAGWVIAICLLLAAVNSQAAASLGDGTRVFPPPLESYGDSQIAEFWKVLQNRILKQPLNLWATLLFLGAIVHTFFTRKFLHWSHQLDERHKARARASKTAQESGAGSIGARLLHFMGEVEAVFGIWCVPLLLLLAARLGWGSAVNYFSHRVSYIEPIFVVVIMAMSSTRPILQLAERLLGFFARLGGGKPAAWWMAALTIGPVLGSLITEPAAMTISALLLGKQLFAFKPSERLAYGTLGLLFVNVSVGGALTHFAAPPVLMVAAPWGWTTPFMFSHFGWVALVGIGISNGLYYVALRKEFGKLERPIAVADVTPDQTPVPVWITISHLAFMAWSVVNSHYPVLLVGGFLFFLAFHEATQEHQSEVQLRSPLLVGFFLAGLVIHGGLQQWWIGPLLGRLKEVPLMLGATALTAVNDNAAITYLATLVPGLEESMKYVVVAGALAGGGLTVIANAPNPAGQAILGRYFRDGVAPSGLLLGALPATIIMILCFLCGR
jgi:hypothetical protein